MSEDTNALSDALKDQKIVSLKQKVNLKKFTLDPTLTEELKSYVIFGDAKRKAFEPKSADDLKQLISEMEKTQAYRDRVTFIMMQSKEISDELDTLIKSGTAYLFAKYGQDIKSLSNQQSRDAAVRFVLDSIIRKRDRWRSVKEVAELAKTNLNETYFALREIGENGRRILDDRNVKRSFDA